MLPKLKEELRHSIFALREELNSVLDRDKLRAITAATTILGYSSYRE